MFYRNSQFLTPPSADQSSFFHLYPATNANVRQPRGPAPGYSNLLLPNVAIRPKPNNRNVRYSTTCFCRKGSYRNRIQKQRQRFTTMTLVHFSVYGKCSKQLENFIHFLRYAPLFLLRTKEMPVILFHTIIHVLNLLTCKIVVSNSDPTNTCSSVYSEPCFCKPYQH